MTETFDNKRVTRHYGLEDVDLAFKMWWNEKLNVFITDKDDNQKKVPVFFFSSERWSKAREDGGVRNKDGTLVLPLIAIIRSPAPSISNDGPAGRSFADTTKEYTVAQEIDPKSSLVKELVKKRPFGFDPTAPIFEVYTVPVPDHYQLVYQVKIWTSYIEDINKIIEKIGQELDFVSEKSFQFATPDGYYFIAFQDDDFNDESNLEEYSGNERLIRVGTTFTVPAHILPESDQRKDSFKRFFSQTKLVIKEETTISEEELVDLLGPVF